VVQNTPTANLFSDSSPIVVGRTAVWVWRLQLQDCGLGIGDAHPRYVGQARNGTIYVPGCVADSQHRDPHDPGLIVF